MNAPSERVTIVGVLATAAVFVALVFSPLADRCEDDVSSEVWWTTTDCPPDVAVPCLDNTVSLEEVTR